MNIKFEYGFNNENLRRFKKYEIQIISNIKYVSPISQNKYEGINTFTELNNPKNTLLIDFINLGKLSLDKDVDSDKLVLDFVNQYGLLGFIYDFAVNRYFTLDKDVLLKEFNYINNRDCLTTIDLTEYFKIFFPACDKKEIINLIEQINKVVYSNSMEKIIIQDYNNLIYQNEKYYEQVDMIIKYAQFLYNILKEITKGEDTYKDFNEIEKLETNHIKVSLSNKGVIVHFISLKEYIDENFKLFVCRRKAIFKDM